MFVNKSLVLALMLVLGFVGVSAAQDAAPRCYTLASLNGNYASIGTYGANVALALGVRHYDGKGNFTQTFIVNQPDPASTTGGRKITTGTNVGTYTVNCDGTGVVHKTTSNGVHSVDDFVITAAMVKDLFWSIPRRRSLRSPCSCYSDPMGVAFAPTQFAQGQTPTEN